MNENSVNIASINISTLKGTLKKPVDSVEIDANGLIGDAHAGDWHRQVSILSIEEIERFSAENGREVLPGEFAENITTRGLNLDGVNILDRLIIGDVELEVTQIGKKCHGGDCAIFREIGECAMPKAGIFCRVLKGGGIRVGDPIKHSSTFLNFHIITLSDRASAGVYEDRSGPEINRILQEFFQDKRWNLNFDFTLIPDDPERLRLELVSALSNDSTAIFTTGGTGIGPSDITPEVIKPMLDKEIPGIMEYIRIKYAERFPNALLSRSVAGIINETLVYSMPGSVNAVRDYTLEITKTLEHAIILLKGIAAH